MKVLQGVLAAALAAMLAGIASSREPDLGPLRAWTLPDYTMISPSEPLAREVVERLSAMDRVLAAMLSPPARSAGVPTYIYIVRANTWSRYLQPSAAIAAEFVPTRFANYLLIDGGNFRSTQLLREAASHEFTHLFLRTRYRGEYPPWFDEGLAMLMENTEIHGAVATVGKPQPDLRYPTIPLEKLLRADRSSPEYLSTSLTSSFHYESWALVHQGLIAEPDFGKQIYAYLKAINDLRPIDEAVTESFGMTTAALDAKTTAYRKQKSFKSGTVQIEPVPEVQLKNGRLLGPAVAYEALAHLMLDTGLHAERVDEVISALEKHDTDSTPTSNLRLRVAARSHDDGAMERQIRSLQPQMSDAEIARETGLAIFERVYAGGPGGVDCSAGLRAHCDRAFELLSRAPAGKADPEGAWCYAMLAASLGRDLDTALKRLQQAGAVMTRHADISMAMALVYEARGEKAPMIQSLQDTVRLSSSTSQREWARRRIDEAKPAGTN